MCQTASSYKLYYSRWEAEKRKRKRVLCTTHLFSVGSCEGRWLRIQEKSLTRDTKHSLVNPFLSTSITVKRETATLAQGELAVNQLGLYLFICGKKSNYQFMSYWHLKSPGTNIHTWLFLASNNAPFVYSFDRCFHPKRLTSEAEFNPSKKLGRLMNYGQLVFYYLMHNVSSNAYFSAIILPVTTYQPLLKTETSCFASS